MTCAVVNMALQISLEILLSNLLGKYPKVELLGHRVILFLIFWTTANTVFHSSCTIWHSCQQGTRVPISSHPCPHLLFSVLPIIAILMVMRWYLMVALDLHFSNDQWCQASFCMLVGICFSSLKKYLFKLFEHFLLCCWAVRVLYIFCMLTFYQISDLQMFSPIL